MYIRILCLMKNKVNVGIEGEEKRERSGGIISEKLNKRFLKKIM